MQIKDFSNDYTVRALGESDIDMIFSLCSSNVLFYQYHPPFVTKESISKDMKALPPHKTYNDKLYFGFFRNHKLVAVMDLIVGYPNEETAFIGFFMVACEYQGQGVGSRIIEHCMHVIKRAGFHLVRLGIDDGNPQSERFWRKNKFVKTGQVYEQEHAAVIMMERIL